MRQALAAIPSLLGLAGLIYAVVAWKYSQEEADRKLLAEVCFLEREHYTIAQHMHIDQVDDYHPRVTCKDMYGSGP